MPLNVLPRTLNAAEIKWVIGQCDLFAGARTHATIAAFSMMVPTLSIAYSIKAWGINRDIFGHSDHVIGVDHLSPDSFKERIQHLVNEATEVRLKLEQRIPEVRKQALTAGSILRQYCRN